MWKLKLEDGTVEQFIDIRRKVGNRILRAYLLDNVSHTNRVTNQNGSLRGPKDEFQDFAKFMILRTSQDGEQFRFLVEAGVYENLRIVGTDNNDLANKEPDIIEKVFTEALQYPEKCDTIITLSSDTKVKMK